MRWFDTASGAIGERGAVAATLRVHHGRADAAPPPSLPAGPVWGADLALSWRLPGGFVAGGALTHWRDAASRRTHAQLWWRHALR